MIRTAHLFAGIEGFRYGLERANDITHEQIKKHNSPLGSGGITQRSEPQLSGGSNAINITDDQSEPSQHGRCSFHTVYTNDFDKYASAITRYHYGEIDERDIRTINPRSIPDIDLLTFGWTCQDNSIAGKRKGQKRGTRSGLLSEAVRILRAKMPRYFLAENVPGLFSVTQGCDFYKAVRLFADAGYDVQWQVLNTRWFLPQNRERIIFVGHLRGTGRPKVFPIGEAGAEINRWDSEKQVALSLQSPGNACGNYRGMNMISVIASLNEGSQASRIYDPCGLSPALRTPSGGHDEPIIKDGLNIRRLTPVECERLQGFPDNWTKYGIDKNGNKIEISDTQRYKCCGNAVSTPVITEIGKRLLRSL